MIITSLLDTDLYKFTMMQVVLHHFPGAQVEYRFKCRNKGVDLTPYVDEIREQIEALCTLRFTEDELTYLRGLRFIKSDFVDFLGLFQLNTKYIEVEPAQPGPGESSACSSSTPSTSRSSRPSPARARSASSSRGRGCTRSCSRSRCWR